MRRIISNIIWSALFNIFPLCCANNKKQKIKGYRIISTEYYRYLTFNDRPSIRSMCFVTDVKQAYVFRDLIEAFPYLLSMDCRFTFEPVIQVTI